MRVTFSFYNRNYRVDIKTYVAETAEIAKTMADGYVADFFQRNGVQLHWIITGVSNDTPPAPVVPKEEIKIVEETTEDTSVRKNSKKTQTPSQE